MPKRILVDEGGLPFAHALRAVFARGYRPDDLRADLGAGLTVGIVALPLSIALAIASGAPPQWGLFTAIVAGILVALTGGSMHSVTGPTAAFVVVLAPITIRFGLSGLLMATLMAGLILVIMGLLRFGRFIQFIPYPVTTGFTAGIAVTIAVLQFGDMLGLGSLTGERIWERFADLTQRFGQLQWPDLAVGLLGLAVLVFLPRWSKRVPAPLVAVVVAALAGFFLTGAGFEVATIDTRFGGIPAVPPTPLLPWKVAGGFDFSNLSELAPSAVAIAMLGAIESLLCAVVADGMTGSRHEPDSELLGLGIGNLLVPFVGGFAATGAIARTATGVRAGGRTPVTAVVHSIFLLVVVLVLAPLLGYIPMAAMSALLLVVAWNMADIHHFARMLRTAPRSDITVLLVCFVLTVTFDMVVAVVVGVVLAAFLFMRRMVEISGAQLIGGPHGHAAQGLPPGVVFYDIGGPLFFGAAEKALGALTTVSGAVHTVIIDLEDVPAVDATGLVALDSTIKHLNGLGIKVVLTGVQPQPHRAFARAGLIDVIGKLEITDNVGDTIERVIAGVKADPPTDHVAQ